MLVDIRLVYIYIYIYIYYNPKDIGWGIFLTFIKNENFFEVNQGIYGNLYIYKQQFFYIIIITIQKLP